MFHRMFKAFKNLNKLITFCEDHGIKEYRHSFEMMRFQIYKIAQGYAYNHSLSEMDAANLHEMRSTINIWLKQTI